MYYFGGGSAAEEMGGKPIRGVSMSIGRATSADGGFTWQRRDGGESPLLAPRAGEQMFVGWPCVHTPPSGQCMYYHAMDLATHGGKFAIGRSRLVRHSAHDGSGEDSREADAVVDEGYVLEPGPPGSFDHGGVSARSVVAHPTAPSTLLMAYEAQDGARRHSIGLATSTDGGATWARSDAPVLAPSEEPSAWDGGAVARPYLVPPLPEDTTARLYYLGRSADGSQQGIGVAESVDEQWSEWVRL